MVAMADTQAKAKRPGGKAERAPEERKARAKAAWMARDKAMRVEAAAVQSGESTAPVKGTHGGAREGAGRNRIELTPAMQEKFIDVLARGRGVSSACDETGIKYKTVSRRRAEDIEFDRAVMRARFDGADYLADETITIVDTPGEDANTKRVRVDARKWLASKLKPAQYGEQLSIEHSGTVDTGGLSAHDLSRLADALTLERSRRGAIDVVDES